MSENDFLAQLPMLFHSGDPSVILGSGPDDCAHILVGPGEEPLTVSTDAFVEGTHFLSDADPGDIACKCLSASLSDLAASACKPRWAVISLCLRPGLARNWAETFARKIAATAKRYGVTIIGGDTISSKDRVFVSVTVMGEPLPGGPLLRSGAKPGDILAITGELGGSILGKHLCPAPRLKEMDALMEFCGGIKRYPSAAMDISDGLASDLSRLCHESGVGAILDEKRIPISPDAIRVSRATGGEPLDHALSDGEDFELLVAMPLEIWRGFQPLQAERTKEIGALARFTRIGEVVAEPGMQIRSSDGSLHSLLPKGYEHKW